MRPAGETAPPAVQKFQGPRLVGCSALPGLSCHSPASVLWIQARLGPCGCPGVLHSHREGLNKASRGFNTSVLLLWYSPSCSQHGVRGRGMGGHDGTSLVFQSLVYIWGRLPTLQSQCSLEGKRGHHASRVLCERHKPFP